ncbi:M20/M25/M40 family metallo-hydrolase [Aquabacter sp. CN5-332]|uniref:M20 family metallopeptidase n=1 Tax=Aquabacter sp. CN5-332 TaxID=3156608 RepID=UPI0032B34808
MTGAPSLRARLEPHLSRERSTRELIDLLRVPSPQTALLEREPALTRFIEAAVEPRLREMGFADCRYDAMGNLIAEIGPSGGPSLMLISHAMNQPPNTMPNPYAGEILDGAPFGFEGEVARGRGASEQKGTLAAMLHGVEAVFKAGIPLRGRLSFICCVSGETGCVDAIRNVVETEKVRAGIAYVYGNSLKLQLGNRGRIDMRIIVHGKPSHSSRPKEGCNAITGAIEVIRRLTSEIGPARSHPQLGEASLTINGLRSYPDSTHTVQARCEISVDRRLLPGDDPDVAAAEIERVAMAVDGMPDPVSGKPWTVEVVRGAYMHPSLVTQDSPAVRTLAAACRAMLGYEPEPMYGQSAFDQGYLNHAGISTVNFGPGEQSFAHTDNDIASLDKVFGAARVFAFLVADHLGEGDGRP